MELVYKVLVDALPVWELAIAKTGWFHAVVVVAYLSAGWLCLANAHIARQTSEPRWIWYLAVIVLCLLGINTLLQLDLLLTHLLRGIAKSQGWYAERRTLQYGAVLLIGAVAAASAYRFRTECFASEMPSQAVSWGLAVLLLIFALRAVSAHGTDALLNARLAGASFGRLMELMGIALVVHGARRCLQVR